MRIRSVLLTAVVLAAAARAQPVWVTRSAALASREEAAVVALGDGKVLLAGGKGSGGAALATVELYDPLSDRFAAAPSLPMPEGRPVGALLRDGAVLLVRDGVAATWLWRPGDAAWSPGPMLPAAVTAPLLARLGDGALLLASASGSSATWLLAGSAWKAGPPLARPNAEALLTLSDGAAAAIVATPGGAGQTVLRLAPGGTGFEGAAEGQPGRGAVAVALPGTRLLLAGGARADGGAASTDALELELTTRARGNIGPLSEGRSAAHATLLPDGRVLLAGGRAAVGLAGTPELFTPDAGFSITASGETRVGHGQALTVEGQVLLLGGRSEAGPVATTSAFDVAASQWALLPPPPGPRLLACGALLPDGRFLLVGGESPNGVVTSSAALFDPAAAAWASAPPPPAGLSRCTATLLWNGQVLVAGGRGVDGKPSSQAFLFSPAQNAWAPAGRLRVPREGARAVLARDGAVWVLGGVKAGRALAAEVERWSASDNRFALKAPLPSPRQGASVTLLPDGRVLVLGGATADGARLIDVDVLEPEKNSWSRDALPQPNVPRAGHTLTVLPGGTLLAWGGQGSGEALAEQLAPGASAWTAWGSGRQRAGHAMLQLPGNALLAVGGDGEGRESAERIDGFSALLLSDEPLPAAAAAPLVVQLLDGRVLVVGGTFAFWRSPLVPLAAPTLAPLQAPRAGQPGAVAGTGFSPALSTGDGYPGAAAANHPVLLLREASGSAPQAALTTAFTEESAQVRWPPVAQGHHRVSVSVNGASSAARLGLFARACTAAKDCSGGTCGAEGVCCDRPCDAGSCGSGACEAPLPAPPGALTPLTAAATCGEALTLEVKAEGVAALSLTEGPMGMTLEGSTLRWAVPAGFSGAAQARFFESEDVLDITVTCAPAPPPPEKKGCGCAAGPGPLALVAALALARARRARRCAG